MPAPGAAFTGSPASFFSGDVRVTAEPWFTHPLISIQGCFSPLFMSMENLSSSTGSHEQDRHTPDTAQFKTDVDAVCAAVRNELGYGRQLENPEAFIRAVIKRMFCPLDRKADWQNLKHEGRVALFEKDLQLGSTVLRNTKLYWLQVARAVGSLLWEDYREQNAFAGWKRPFSLDACDEDDPSAPLLRRPSQQREPDPAEEVACRDWMEHYRAMAADVILAHEDPAQGERDMQVFDMWVSGYTPKEIADHPDVTWLHTSDAADGALRRIIGRLRKHFGTDADADVNLRPQKGTVTHAEQAQKHRFARWYDNEANRTAHRERCRQQAQARRAAERAQRAEEF